MKKIIIIILWLWAIGDLHAQNKRVIISEIMYDTPLNEKIAFGIPYSNGEFIELYNGEDKAINLEGWSLHGSGSTEEVEFGDEIILPHHNLIVAYRHRDTPTFRFEDIYTNLIHSGFDESKIHYQNKLILSNSGESVYLKDDEGFVHDSIYYDGTSHKTKPNRLSAENADTAKLNSCYSLQRIEAHYNANGLAIPNNSEWITAVVTPFDYQDYRDSVSNSNYINTKIFLSENRNRYIEKTDYFNGLGFLKERVEHNITPNYKNLVTLYEYDLADRENRSWLPLITDTAGYINPMSYKISVTNNDIYNDLHPYSEKNYDCGAYERISTCIKPGEIYHRQNKKETYTYGVNLQKDSVILFKIDPIRSTIKRELYPVGVLLKESVIDEDGLNKINFIDQNGQVVLTREQNIDTYKIYDGLGRLRFIIPPMAVDKLKELLIGNLLSSIITDYCYSFQYDKFGNLFKKQLPGKAPDYYIYAGDVLLLWQNGELRKSNRWIRNIYDTQHRLEEQQIVQGDQPAEELINWANSYQGNIIPEAQHYKYKLRCVHVLSKIRYHKQLYEQEPSQTGSIRFREFDTPSYLNFQSCTDIVDRNDVASLWGVKKYEKHAIIADTVTLDFVERAYYYNKLGQLVQKVEKNHLGGINRTSYLYDFTGNILAYSESAQAGPNAKPNEKKTYYTYDHANRLKSENTVVDNGINGVINYQYDELGRLAKKTYGMEPDTLSEQFTYNLQGWETSRKSKYLDLYLRYYDPQTDVRPSFTGNITEWEWQHKDSEGIAYDKNQYTFTYDQLSRLANSNLFVNDLLKNNRTEKDITYDKQGNIKTLTRTANDLCHSIKYKYKGNRIATINDSDMYNYDANGNMIYDGRLQYSIGYNFLNRIKNIMQNGTIKAKYTYLSDGTKLSLTTPSNDGFEYLGSLEYQRNNGKISLESVSFGGGRFIAPKVKDMMLLPNYYLTDHLGSSRVIFAANGKVKERNDYYPFGKRWDTADRPVSDNRYLYNGKEMQLFVDTGWLDYGARMYDNNMARWITPDPLCEQRIAISTYQYAGNNPVNRVDEEGLLDDKYYNSLGYLIYDTGKGDKTYVIRSPKLKDISLQDVIDTEKKISQGILTGDHMNNIVRIESVSILRKMKAVIKDDGTGGPSAANNKEYGGIVDQNGQIKNVVVGQARDPETNTPAHVRLNISGARSVFHSHPSSLYLKNGITMGSSSTPSETDFKSIGSSMGYIFQMRKKEIIVFDQEKVQTFIPFTILDN